MVNAFGGKIKTRASGGTSKKTKDHELQVEILGKEKLKDMERMEKEREDNIIVFTPETYFKYVIQNPRPYDIVMLYNVNEESDSRCPHCEKVQEEYGQVVFSFLKERGSNQNMEQEKKIFFGILYFQQVEKIQQIWLGHGLVNVPYLAVSFLDMKRPPRLESFYPEEAKWLIN